jgi:hypothetical protein
MTPQNLKAIKDGHAYVTLGQSAFVQGYLPVALLVNAIKTKAALGPGFFNSGTQVVTAKSVDMGNGLPPVTFEQTQALAADLTATAKYYKPSLAGNGLLASMKPIATEPDCGVELIGTSTVGGFAINNVDAGIEPSGRIAARRGTRRPLSTRPMKLWRTTSS